MLLYVRKEHYFYRWGGERYSHPPSRPIGYWSSWYVFAISISYNMCGQLEAGRRWLWEQFLCWLPSHAPTSVPTAASLAHHRPLALVPCWLCFPPLPFYWICFIPDSLLQPWIPPLLAPQMLKLKMVSVRAQIVRYLCDCCWRGCFFLFSLVELAVVGFLVVLLLPPKHIIQSDIGLDQGFSNSIPGVFAASAG